MFEIINLNAAKKNMKQLNVIIYGTIRNCEDHFHSSFSNIELIASYFNSACIIILENDSLDTTRQLLLEWSKQNIKNIIKQTILLNDLEVNKCNSL